MAKKEEKDDATTDSNEGLVRMTRPDPVEGNTELHVHPTAVHEHTKLGWHVNHAKPEPKE